MTSTHHPLKERTFFHNNSKHALHGSKTVAINPRKTSSKSNVSKTSLSNYLQKSSGSPPRSRSRSPTVPETPRKDHFASPALNAHLSIDINKHHDTTIDLNKTVAKIVFLQKLGAGSPELVKVVEMLRDSNPSIALLLRNEGQIGPYLAQQSTDIKRRIKIEELLMNDPKPDQSSDEEELIITNVSWVYSKDWEVQLNHQAKHSEKMKFLTEECSMGDANCRFHLEGSSHAAHFAHANVHALKNKLRRFCPTNKNKRHKNGCRFFHKMEDARTELLNEVLHLCDLDIWHPNEDTLKILNDGLNPVDPTNNLCEENKLSDPKRRECSFTTNSLNYLKELPITLIKDWFKSDSDVKSIVGAYNRHSKKRYTDRFKVAVNVWGILRFKFIERFSESLAKNFISTTQNFQAHNYDHENLNKNSEFVQSPSAQFPTVQLANSPSEAGMFSSPLFDPSKQLTYGQVPNTSNGGLNVQNFGFSGYNGYNGYDVGNGVGNGVCGYGYGVYGYPMHGYQTMSNTMNQNNSNQSDILHPLKSLSTMPQMNQHSLTTQNVNSLPQSQSQPQQTSVANVEYPSLLQSQPQQTSVADVEYPSLLQRADSPGVVAKTYCWGSSKLDAKTNSLPFDFSKIDLGVLVGVKSSGSYRQAASNSNSVNASHSSTNPNNSEYVTSVLQHNKSANNAPNLSKEDLLLWDPPTGKF